MRLHVSLTEDESLKAAASAEHLLRLRKCSTATVESPLVAMVRAQIGSSDRKIVLLRKALRNETDERGYTVLTGVPAEEFRNPPPSKLVNPPLVEWQMAV